MTQEFVRDLFRSLEATLHDRLRVIEELLNRSHSGATGGSHDADKKQMKELEKRMDGMEEHFQTLTARIASQVVAAREDLDTLERIVTDGIYRRLNALDEAVARLSAEAVDKPVEAVQAEAEETAAVVAEALAAEQEPEEEADEEEEVEDEEEEDDEVELTPFTYGKQNRTFYRDAENNVYGVDEDGNVVDEILGRLNPTTGKIIPVRT